MSEKESKKQILKSTGVLGFVQVVEIVVGIIRVKVIAILLGPVGVGISGIYQNTISLISSATSFGIGYSGIRDVAKANATGDKQKLAITALILKRWAWFTGLLGMVITILLCKPLSHIAFGNYEHAWNIAILSIALLLSALTGGLSAILRGLRRIKDMAKANVAGSVIGLVTAILIYRHWGIKGIVPAILVTYISAQIINWIYVRRVKTEKAKLTLAETYFGGIGMAKLGFFMVVSSFITMGTLYIVRAFIVQKSGLESVGYFTAAWTISTMYISAILTAMGADFYPRLSALQDNDAATVDLINHQTEVAVLLAGPVIIGMISFIDIVVRILYSKNFAATSSILTWQMLGDFFKIISWPLGYVFLARGKGKLYILTEALWNLAFIGITFLSWKYFNIESSGIAFLIAYVGYLIVVYGINQKRIGFRWSSKVFQYILLLMLMLITAFLVTKLWHGIASYSLGIVLSFSAAIFSLRELKKVLDVNVLPKLRLPTLFKIKKNTSS